MGYSDSNFQLGQMLHKEYEATYATANATNTGDLLPPVKLVSTISTIVAAVVFVAQIWTI